MVGASLASKNNLKVGSTFAAYNTTITVSGIYNAGNTFNNGGIIMPLATVQTLSDQSGDVTTVIVQVDSITNVNGTVTALQNKLGTSVADVVSSQDSANQALAPLQNIKTISLYSLIGALVAGSVITFLVMLMIVRERRREIGVLKAIGASNNTIVGQFVTEALTLTLLGAMIGTILGIVLSNPILNILVSNSTQSPSSGGFGGGGGGFAARGGGAIRSFFGGGQQAIRTLHTVVSFDILLYGLAVAILIAVLGSAIPAWLIC